MFNNIEYQYLISSFDAFDTSVTDSWLTGVIKEEGGIPGQLSFIYCDDEYLLSLNRKFLQHDTLTDVITFDYGEEMGDISGDIFISVERVQDNAVDLGILFHEELFRVMVHGILHLLGYTDHDQVGREQMREKENYYLSLLP